LDEPSSGIAQKETEALGPLLRQVQATMGCSILIIEHDMPLITSLADRIVALESGAVITVGPPGDVLSHPEVVASYLGTANTDLAHLATGTRRNSNGKRTNGKRTGNGNGNVSRSR